MKLSSSLCIILLAFPACLAGQNRTSSPRDSVRDTPASKEPAPASAPALDFSGVLYANFQYRADTGPSKAANRFDVERAYLTFRMPAGERTSIRVTTDLYQQTNSADDGYYRGWTVRAKYAYLQYNYLNGPDWKAVARLGLLHTVFIEHDEDFWLRWISQTPTDRAGYFSSSDAGIATSVTFPRRLGEIYATITNGPGYTSRETDRFKDYAARLTLAPWASAPSGFLRAVAVSGWAYKGATASKFVVARPGEVGPIGSALDRSRWGVHAAAKDPRATIGLEYSRRYDGGESGLNTISSPRVVVDTTGTLAAAYVIVRPLALANGSDGSPLSLIARFDRVSTNVAADRKYNVFIGGVAWDLSKGTSFSLDYQSTTPVAGTPVTPVKTWFAHFVAKF